MEGISIFDSHCHLDDPRFDADRPAVLEQLRAAGVYCTCVGADMRSSQSSMALAQAHPFIWAAVGLHPHDAKDFADGDLDRLRDWLGRDRVVALGEIGLDYHYDNSPRETQREVFARQMELAMELQAPMILHVREAHGDTLELLRQRKGRLPGFIVHCYSGSAESAREYMDLGGMISFAGSVTFPNAHNLREAAACVPMDRLLIETDSPYMAPQPRRGQRNQPDYVAFVAEQVAAIKGLDAREVAEATTRNALAFYRICEEAPHE